MNVSTLIKTLTVTAALFATMAEAAIVKTGTIKSLDLSEKTLVLDTGSNIKRYSLPENVNVNLFGENGMSTAALEAGQRVKLKFAKAEQPLRGEIISVNHDLMTAQIKVKGSSRVADVKFTENVSVKGISDFSELKEGHLVTLK